MQLSWRYEKKKNVIVGSLYYINFNDTMFLP